MLQASLEEGKLWAKTHQYTVSPEEMTMIILCYLTAKRCNKRSVIEYLETILTECGMNDIIATLRKGLYGDSLKLYRKLYYIEET